MEIENHFKIILDKYNLHSTYTKFVIFSMFNAICRECVYWFIIYFSVQLKTDYSLLYKYAIIVLLLYTFHIFVRKTYIDYKTNFLNKIRLANYDYFYDKLLHVKKTAVLKTDFINYCNSLEVFLEQFFEYLMYKQSYYNFPIDFAVLIILLYYNDLMNMLVFFIIFYFISIYLNETKLTNENKLITNILDYEEKIRNYSINSKELIINNQYNKKYIDDIIQKKEIEKKNIFNLNANLEHHGSLLILIYIVITLYLKKDNFNPLDFFTYFVIIYDIEYIGDKINEKYRFKANYNVMLEKLKYLNSIEISNSKENIKVENKDTLPIEIDEIENTLPSIKNTKPIIIKKNDHILVDGDSGSGKTSLLYVLKGMIEANKLVIKPSIENINSDIYMMLSNNKGLFSANLYDIITNFNKNPDIELINKAISIAKFDKINSSEINSNEFIDFEKLSGGEKMRLYIAKLIYTIKTNNYNILFLDELDENLNDDLAVEIISNLLSLFKDKTILYISHNDKIKGLFKKKISIKNGIISN
jgi:ABC-type transport system involved in cytochrome bd biosynthesis fused ATPase/permease subunit